ncbi:hypothetical protein NE237_025780 [Protea cynaroides]|uniref:F-box domain-containing protein n=1 Tax=Protea cynaroides TaxID=273540 RepID=A0A9Q0JZV6_9MAGN|nr:hypothetical protein NE237_025780 [Protea cynaroides]
MEEVKHLPCEIVSEILSRLPIESIMQFKSVCKSWFSLIEDPSFVKLQLKRAKSQPHRLILWSNQVRKNWVLLLDRDKEGKDMWKGRDISLEYTFKYEKQDHCLNFIIVGSCNGLLCMVSTFWYGCCSIFYGIFICNPITQECTMLPVGGGRFFDGGDIAEGQIGFGVDSSGKYKVIQIFKKQSFSSDVDDDCGLKGEIITLGESSWREIEIPYKSFYSRDDSWRKRRAIEGMVFMNGVLYCIIQKPTTHEVSDQPIILVFNLDDDKFSTIEFRPSIELPPYYELGLTEIKGSLALHHRLDFYDEPSILRMWLIDINKSKGNQLYHCDHTRVPKMGRNFFVCFDLVGMLSNNLLLYTVEIERGTLLLAHCLEKKQFMRVQIPQAIPSRFQAKSFVPSLVSPIAIACGKTKKDGRYKFQGLHLEVVGYSSLWEFMSSCLLHPTFSPTLSYKSQYLPR